MADRTWNAVSCDEYSKPWSKCARRVWVHIQIIQPNQFGVFGSLLGAIKDHWEDVYSGERIDKALAELVDVGVLKTYRDGTVWWVVRKFSREAQGCNTKRQLAGLHNHLEKYPEVREDFLAMYDGYCEKIEWALGELAKESAKNVERVSIEPVRSAKEPLKNLNAHAIERLITDPDPDSDSETKRTNSLADSDESGSSDRADPVVRLKQLEAALPPPVLSEWRDFKEMAASKRASKKIQPSVLLKHLEQIVATQRKLRLTAEQLSFGLQQAIIYNADNHTYVLKSAQGFNARSDLTATAQPQPRRSPGARLEFTPEEINP